MARSAARFVRAGGHSTEINTVAGLASSAMSAIRYGLSTTSGPGAAVVNGTVSSAPNAELGDRWLISAPANTNAANISDIANARFLVCIIILLFFMDNKIITLFVFARKGGMGGSNTC